MILEELKKEYEKAYNYYLELSIIADCQGMFSPLWEQVGDVSSYLYELREEIREKEEENKDGR